MSGSSKKEKLSDRALVKELTENPYLQYFIGMESFSKEPPLKPTVLANLRKRINADYLVEANDIILEIMAPTAEHELKSESDAAIEANKIADEIENLGTEILDATCSPSNIKYPQDFELLNDAREKLEAIIDSIHKAYHPWKKPRTYRRVARK